MAAGKSKPYFSIELVYQPRQRQTLTPESRYWRSFKTTPLSTNLILPVTSLEFSPSPPHDLAFSVSASVHLYGGSSFAPKPFSPLTLLSDVAYSPSFRCDGQLIAADGESKLVQVLAEKLPQLLDFPKDLVSLKAAWKIQLKTLAEEMQAISKGLEKVEHALTASENDGHISETFRKGRNADALALILAKIQLVDHLSK